jgi:cell division transport system permease protein
MTALWRLPIPRQGRLLPESRFAGPMPWVLAIMMFLTVLTAAAGFGLGQAASHLRESLAGRITVQIVEADPRAREQQTQDAIRELRRLAGVGKVQRVEPEKLKKLLEPWLGGTLGSADVPMPDMIDVDLTQDGHSRIAGITEVVRSVASSARIDQHSQWLAPLDQLLSLLKWLSFALVILMATATSFTVVLAARATLDNHRDTIDVMHLLGATDGQIARLFERRIALDALFGGTIGFLAALLIIFLLSRRIEGLGSELIGSVTLSAGGWILLLLLPLAGTALAMATARLTILNSLGRIL